MKSATKTRAKAPTKTTTKTTKNIISTKAWAPEADSEPWEAGAEAEVAAEATTADVSKVLTQWEAALLRGAVFDYPFERSCGNSIYPKDVWNKRAQSFQVVCCFSK